MQVTPAARLALIARVFAWPAVLAASSLAGLVIALLGNGGYDAAGAALLSAPVLAVIWALIARRR